MYNPGRRKIIKHLAAFPFLGGLVLKGFGNTKPAASAASSPKLALSLVRIICTLQARYYENHESYLSLQELRDGKILSKVFGPDRIKRDEPSPAVRDFFANAKPYSDEIIKGWRLWLRRSPNGQAFTIILYSADKLYVSDEEVVIYTSNSFSAATFPTAYASLASIRETDLQPIDNEESPKRTTVGSLIRRVAFMSVANPASFDDCPGDCADGPNIACCVWGLRSCKWCCFSSCSTACLYCGIGYLCPSC